MSPNTTIRLGLTLSGVDNATPIRKLAELQQRYPFVEFGVLYGFKSGEPRYPTSQWIDRAIYNGLNLSMHMCGRVVKYVVDGIPGWERIRIPDHVNRIQWNVGHVCLDAVRVDLKEKHSRRAIERMITVSRDLPMLIQMGGDTSIIFDRVTAARPTRFPIYRFHDASRGHGITPTEWPKRQNGENALGYGGGLNPHNIHDHLPRILESALLDDLKKSWDGYRLGHDGVAHEDRACLWIDCETGIRTDNAFDIYKAEAMCEAVAEYDWERGR